MKLRTEAISRLTWDDIFALGLDDAGPTRRDEIQTDLPVEKAGLFISVHSGSNPVVIHATQPCCSIGIQHLATEAEFSAARDLVTGPDKVEDSYDLSRLSSGKVQTSTKSASARLGRQ